MRRVLARIVLALLLVVVVLNWTYGRLPATLPHARLEMVAGGHMAPYTHPETIAEAVRALAALYPSSR
ncbi:MAG TPA: hypothetical protein VK756_11420 [Solirubrobacteraceae bacterium]|nr:hypothetical protein [Solirubrobacteraceae bacterium]